MSPAFTKKSSSNWNRKYASMTRRLSKSDRGHFGFGWPKLYRTHGSKLHFYSCHKNFSCCAGTGSHSAGRRSWTSFHNI